MASLIEENDMSDTIIICPRCRGDHLGQTSERMQRLGYNAFCFDCNKSIVKEEVPFEDEDSRGYGAHLSDEEKMEAWHAAVSDRADDLVTAELNAGATFSEGLTNWAINAAMREIDKPELS